MIEQLTPRPLPKWVIQFLLGLLSNKWQIRALIREDLDFQLAVLTGASPGWVFNNWRIQNRQLTGFWNGAHWAASILLNRHADSRRFLVQMSLVALPVWLLMRIRKILGGKK